ncbi:MAG: SDR family oxidoreductase [Thaumarchaeota archaeon]|nr:MAG: SDR family oxidoreductase [Nitrososphaerota archaeon]TLX92488.1 MAG: SDR family oxidoreductase [Nitrososphaerota archaeon]
MHQVALITGCSSGIGYETALMLARNGFHTFATMRNTKKSDSLEEIIKKERLDLNIRELDVNDDTSIENTINCIKKEANRIDVLINNAGYGLVGFFEDLTLDEIRNQFETNFFGVLNITKKIIPIMRLQKSGTIINVSSGAGQVGFPGISAYVSTKFAIEGFSESLMYELFPYGIKVAIIEPGVIKTNFFRNCIVSEDSMKKSSSYSRSLNKFQKNVELMQEHATSPIEVAKVIIQVLGNSEPKQRYIVGNDVAMILEAKKNLSDIEFKKMMMQNII